MFTDGQEDTTIPSGFNLTATSATSNDFLLGGRDYMANLYWNGSVDDFMIFNYSITPEQIYAIFNNQTNTIVSQETTVGDVWQSCVTGNDGTQDGTTNCSNTLTILAASPETPGTFIINSSTTTSYNFSDGGVYSNTEYNSGFGGVILSAGQKNGNYTSPVFNSSEGVWWKNITLTTQKIELPDNQVDEGMVTDTYPVNMSGNVLLLHMNELAVDQETLYDSSGYGNNATTDFVSLGGTCNAEGIYHGGCFFTNSDDEVITIPDSPSLGISGELTIMMWIKPDAVSDVQMLIEKRDAGGINYQFYTSTNRLYFLAGSSVGDNGLSLQADKWNHVAVTVNASNAVRLYLNGQMGTSTSSFAVSYNDAPLLIGTHAWVGNQDFSGSMDEIAIFDRGFTHQEINESYKRGAARLGLSVRGCSNPTCSGEPWTDVGDNMFESMDIANHEYFQYMVDFNNFTINDEIFPRLYNVTIRQEPALNPIMYWNEPPTPLNGTTVNADNPVYLMPYSEGYPSAFVDVDNSLGGYWKFDENAGVDANDSGMDGIVNNGSIQAGTTWGEGKFGSALIFNGSSGGGYNS